MSSSPQKSLHISCLLLRKIVGGLGAALPFVLAIGGVIIFTEDLQYPLRNV